MNYIVNALLTLASLVALAVPVAGAGAALEAVAYVTACALAVLSILVGVLAARAVAPGATISTVSIGNEGASRIGAGK